MKPSERLRDLHVGIATGDNPAPLANSAREPPAEPASGIDVEPAERLSFFRKEVAERNSDVLASHGLLPRPPRRTGLLIAGLLAVFAGAAALIARGVVPRAEFVPGYLEPAGGVARVRAPRQGILGAVYVADGQLVNRGDPLVTLQSIQTTESGADAEAEIAAQLQSERADLEAQIAREDEWKRAEERRLTLVFDESSHDCDLIERGIETLRQQLDLTEAHAERIHGLAERGIVTTEELQRRQMAALSQRLALQNAERELASKRQQAAVAHVAIEQLPTTAGERLRSLREALANVQQRAIEIDARRAVILRASVGGRVAAVPAAVGAAVDGGSLIATIVPEGSELHARLFVPTHAIGKVRVGQAVAIRYDAFPYQRYGTFKGRIADVSNSVLLPQDVDKVSPLRLNEPAYVLDVAIERQDVALGDTRHVALRPDMLLSATIEIDRQSILAWIGESIFGVTQH